ncbi:NAD(P)H-binding [Dyadobacter soli]|uniref:NAD(P)H-binding n=1 Tax=Dyadobacter soli TaxID=659014 RepID=A0A1G7AC26_9BACT|nr:NAD(P)H-binding protein [Dyadobacter soli]SDE12017.1 NAD(P)H-binding [Dyadobacter soli]
MKAIIIGATGASGKNLLDIVLNDPDYLEVAIFVRRPTGITDPKLTEVVTDFDNLKEVSGQIHGDVLFSCLGTTLKAAGSKENQWHIDYEIPLEFAQTARRNGVPQMVLLSAYGASPDSNVFYSMLKGKLEERITALAFKKLVIFKPGLLLRKNSDRFGERASATTLNFLNGLGLFKKFRPMPTELLAEKLAKAPKTGEKQVSVVSLDEIFSY